MRTSIKIAAVIAILVGASNLAAADGPVRQGLRNAGQATANVAQGVVQGAANVAQGVGNATANVVGATGNAVGLTPATPMQARGGAGFDTGRDARWRFARHNNEWWYYNDNNQWQYHRDGQWHQFSQDSFQPSNQQLAQDQQFQHGQQHSVGYRGMEQGQQVRHDHHGRAFICENGQAVYLDQQQGGHNVARQNFDSQQVEQQAQPGEPTPAEMQGQQGQADVQGQVTTQSAPQAAAPADPAPATGGQITGDGSADVSSAPAGPTSGSQAQGDVAAPREINNNPTSQTNGATDNPGR